MTKDKGILIQNIYVMLSYAFNELMRNNYENIAKDDFDSVLDLLSEILYKGVSKQLKQGLHREYVNRTDSLQTLRGKLDFNGTIKNIVRQQKAITCEFDELSVNNIFNQIIATTLDLLIREPSLENKRKRQLIKLIPFFEGISIINPQSFCWNSLVYQRNNNTYRMLMNICYFILDGLLMTTEKGEYRMATFTDKYMHRLFEHFVLEYYKRHHPALRARAEHIEWDLADDQTSVIQLLPSMKSDIILHSANKQLVIDTKYYQQALIQNWGKNEIRSANMYQIFTYVKNLDKTNSGNVSGLLLYAKTEEEVAAELDTVIGNNRIQVKTLDLNQPYKDLFAQLDSIVKDWLRDS